MTYRKAPLFWWQKPGFWTILLSPFSWMYGCVSAWRMNRAPSNYASVPVICVGNFIAGGGGKTPTVLALVAQAKAIGLNPGILSRGYGGKAFVPTCVDLQKHNARDVGDEPLLLAKLATTVVSANRPAGAHLLVKNGCNLIIMDDGFQSPGLYKDFSLVVVDAKRGIGNGFTHPSGPLRAPIFNQLPHANAILIIGEGAGGNAITFCAKQYAKPIQFAKVEISNKDRLKRKNLLAYAGIASPEFFFASLSSTGAQLVEQHAFGDHHCYSNNEIKRLLDQATSRKLHLVSTAKDVARLCHMGELSQKLLNKTDVIEIELKFDDSDFAKQVIDQAIQSAEKRLGEGE